MKTIGYWCNGYSIELVEIGENIYALYGWNGEKYLHCWRCIDKYTSEDSNVEYEIAPIYNEDFDVVDYKLV